jgi:hypothetical protein
MDINSLAKGVSLFGSALTAVRQALELLPNSAKKADAVAAIERAEREFKLAEATAATNLGYELCHRHFPPEIMLSEGNNIWECPTCKNRKDNNYDVGLLDIYSS